MISLETEGLLDLEVKVLKLLFVTLSNHVMDTFSLFLLIIIRLKIDLGHKALR